MLKSKRSHSAYLSQTFVNPLNANPEKWSNTLKQIVGNLPTICLSVFDHFMNLALKGLIYLIIIICLITPVTLISRKSEFELSNNKCINAYKYKHNCNLLINLY